MKQLIKVLQENEGTYLLGRDLKQLSNYQNQSDMRRDIAKLRSQGFVIIGSNKGYKYVGTKSKFEEWECAFVYCQTRKKELAIESIRVNTMLKEVKNALGEKMYNALKKEMDKKGGE